MNTQQTGQTTVKEPVIDQTSGIGHQPGASPGIGHNFEASDGLHTIEKTSGCTGTTINQG